MIRLRDFQNEYQKQRWEQVRIVHNWNLMLVEHALAIYLWHTNSPADGYKLAAHYCQNYDAQYGSGLNGPSRTKIEEIVRFMFTIEALEDSEVMMCVLPMNVTGKANLRFKFFLLFAGKLMLPDEQYSSALKSCWHLGTVKL